MKSITEGRHAGWRSVCPWIGAPRQADREDLRLNPKQLPHEEIRRESDEAKKAGREPNVPAEKVPFSQRFQIRVILALVEQLGTLRGSSRDAEKETQWVPHRELSVVLETECRPAPSVDLFLKTQLRTHLPDAERNKDNTEQRDRDHAHEHQNPYRARESSAMTCTFSGSELRVTEIFGTGVSSFTPSSCRSRSKGESFFFTSGS